MHVETLLDGDEPEIAALGPRIRGLRRRSGLSQKQLADFSTLSVRSIRDIENGRVKTPRRDTIRLLAQALHLKADDQDLVEVFGPSDSVQRQLQPRDMVHVPPPAADGPLFGRDDELAVLRRLLAPRGRRLLTITGIEGAGKTRLALEFARTWHMREAGSVLWVPLMPTPFPGSSREEVEEFLFERIGDLLSGEAHFPGHAADLIGGRRALLILDGAPAASTLAAAVADLLSSCPGLTVLCTARSTPDAPIEELFPLAPLPLPRVEGATDPSHLEQVPSVRMLLTRVQQIRPTFELNSRNAEYIANICRALDGLPKALELAARWILVYSPQQLAQQLAHDPAMVARRPVPLATQEPEAFDSVRHSVRALTFRQHKLLSTMGQTSISWSISDIAKEQNTDFAQAADDVYNLFIHGLLRRTDETDASLFATLNIVRRFGELWV
ncbi:helix-turn-helix domain-containing protein [Streptomyces oceani]|uniref:helix-turn-helix domain-containing protein n=1 Tax=Streptomyces oceani TaxID=1075402 RepID=UPI0014818D6C|nr:helix-turn-helix domain-containing protein [Streptomyces oceani]